MDWETLYSRHEGQLEDFWGRRNNRPAHRREFTIFGHPVYLASNYQVGLESVKFAQPLYSVAPRKDGPPFHIELIVSSAPASPGLPTADLVNQIQYTGHDQWLAIQLGRWGHCQVDLAGKKALAVLTPELAERPALVSRYLLNTILTNFLIATGYGFLHTTGVLKGDRALLLVATHNSGKSTAALRLALAGYRLLSDSMIFVGQSNQGPGIELYGFPIGRIKLRADMIKEFPQLKSLLQEESVRGEIKYSADLRQYDPALVHEAVVKPTEVYLCLLTRADESATDLRPATISEAMETVMTNSIFYDMASVWQRNLSCIQLLLERAHCYQLRVGSDPAGILATAERLWKL